LTGILLLLSLGSGASTALLSSLWAWLAGLGYFYFGPTFLPLGMLLQLPDYLQR